MKLFSESTSVPVKTGTPGRWSAVFLTEGAGSSGNWLRETIERDGPAALPKGSRCFVTHNRLENGEPDPFRMWGVLAEDAQYDGNGNLVGEIDILPSWVDRVEEVAPHTALSVYLMGEADENGDITRIHQDIQNGVDMVVHPGRSGSSLVEKLYESATSHSETPPGARLGDNKKENKLEKEEFEAALKPLADAVAALVSEKKAAEAADAQVKADQSAVSSAVESFEAAIVAIEAADLLAPQVESLRAAAKSGQDVAPLIESAKAVKDAAVKAVTEAAGDEGVGRILGESGTDYVLSGFGGGK